MKLKLYNRDEIFMINLDSVLFFKAEDHYTSVYYGKDIKQLLPFGLSQLVKSINELPDYKDMFARLGRSHLLNIHNIVHASVVKETVTMLSKDGSFVSVHIPRVVIKEMLEKEKIAKQ